VSTIAGPSAARDCQSAPSLKISSLSNGTRKVRARDRDNTPSTKVRGLPNFHTGASRSTVKRSHAFELWLRRLEAASVSRGSAADHSGCPYENCRHQFDCFEHGQGFHLHRS
jgi:hypothetical protein